MERPRPLDPTECEYAIRQFNVTDSPQLGAFDHNCSFTFFDGTQKQRFLETKEPPFRFTKLNT